MNGQWVQGLRMFAGSVGALFFRGATQDAGTPVEGGDFTALEIPADYAAKRAAGTPYRIAIDDETGLPYWEASTVSDAAFVPTFIADGDTFRVPPNRQALFAMDIDNEGTLDIEGFLIQVD